MGSFNDVCEGDIFKKGKQLNLYPHYAVISFLLKEEPNQRRRMKLVVGLEITFGWPRERVIKFMVLMDRRVL